MENPKLFDSNRLKRSLGARSPRGATVKLLRQPGFPLYYMLRNLGWLKSEKWWASLPPRAKRVQALRMLGQRAAIFKEVKNWRANRHKEPTTCAHDPQDLSVPHYCNKCGLCCEVASGMAVFPFPREVPPKWKELFANGLGKGHRFCPFLWEDNGTAGGLCSIYHLRSNPCRLFGVEECEFFRQTTEPEELSNRAKILKTARWLARNRNLRPLPPRA